jgi:hypothetical protein
VIVCALSFFSFRISQQSSPTQCCVEHDVSCTEMVVGGGGWWSGGGGGWFLTYNSVSGKKAQLK